MSQILYPGEYFIELEFDRPVSPVVLHRALSSMGFGVVVFDQSLPQVEVGKVTGAAAATAVRATAAVSAAKPKAPAPAISSPPVALPKPTAAVMASPAAIKPPATVATTLAAANAPVSQLANTNSPPRAPATASPRTPITVQSRYNFPAASATSAIADGGRPAALKPVVSKTLPAALSPVRVTPSGQAIITQNPSGSAAAASAALSKPFPGDLPAGAISAVPNATAAADGGGGGAGGGGGSSAPASEDESSPPDAPLPESPDDGGAPAAEPLPDYSYLDYDPSQDPATSQGPSANALAASPSGPSPFGEAALTDLWTRWKEWGSPFATGPQVSGMSVAGETDDDPLRFRVLARLDVAISLDDAPGMRWIYVKKLALSFLSDLVFQANPHQLRQGSLYELRFLSRAKSNPTRESVKESLLEMGFQPIKLSAIKRNMNMPRRGASLTLWYGMAVWNRADSVIISDDPFFFETAKEIRPL